jgi:hypothetical protein
MCLLGRWDKITMNGSENSIAKSGFLTRKESAVPPIRSGSRTCSKTFRWRKLSA